jgi:hypothetical protein
MTREELIDVSSKSVTDLFASTGEFHMLWHAITANDAPLLLPQGTVVNFVEEVVGGEEALKDLPRAMFSKLAARVVQSIFEKFNVKMYVMVDEAWTIDDELTASMTRAQFEWIRENGVSKFPGAHEVIVYSAEDYAGRTVAQQVINRVEGGKPTLGPLTYLPVEKTMHVGGQAFGLLPEKKENESRSLH